MNITQTVKLSDVLSVVRSAEKAVLDIYNQSEEFAIEYKADTSPVTAADLQSHTIITEGLAALDPNIPIVSEEQDESINLRSMQSDTYWLIDPIDGTKEFIARNGQFTICIAYMKHKRPVFGIVSAPALQVLYYGGKSFGSYKIFGDSAPQLLQHTIPEKIVYGSISHSNPETKRYIQEHYAGYAVQSLGSQLKFVYLADSKAAAYPRIGSTMKIWDIAAGHAILEGVGGVVEHPDSTPIFYKAGQLLAGDFIAYVNE